MKFISICLLLICTTNVLALGQTGHRVTGELAERHINDHTKKALKAILGYETLAEASTWADEMRTDPAEFWQKTASPYHYVTVPKGKTYSEVGAPKQGDAVFALNKFSKIVKNKSSTKEEKSLALKFIVHIIGDLHQPLHAGNGEDHGGNWVKLKFYRKDTNLHRIWDTNLIERRHLSFTEWTNWLDKEISPSDIKKWETNNPLVWIKESVKIRDVVYPKEESIGYAYQYKNMPVIKMRLKQAGIRIAYYLDELFKSE
ncbi:MAG: S1/P1 Nuclease [Kangiella sp.]|nr:MAG: S1/P1 Nuclease [Kangiella sp.]